MVSRPRGALFEAGYAKSSAYINNMPWGLVNYEYKCPRWDHPLHSTLGRRLDQI